MEYKQMITLLVMIFFSHSSYSCDENEWVNKSSINSNIKVEDVVSIAIGKNTRTHTEIGTVSSNDKQNVDIEIGTISHQTIGENVSSCIQLPIGNILCN
jgi:hypothetical protein